MSKQLQIRTVSTLLNLPKNQSLHKFADLAIDGPDNNLFTDPIQLALNEDPFSKEAHATLTDFFQQISNILRTPPLDKFKLKSLLKYSAENNSTRLGTSRVIPNTYSKGKGCTPHMLYNLFTRYDVIKLAEKGVFDTTPANATLFIKGFDKDRMTDLVNSIIFKLLIEFTDREIKKAEQQTQKKVRKHPLKQEGMYWNRHTHQWEKFYYDQYLDFNGHPLVLMPKNILTGYYVYNAERYIRGHVLLAEQKRRLNEAKAKDPKAKKEKIDNLEKEFRKSLNLNSATYKDMLVEFTLKQKNLEMLSDFKKLDPFSNTLSYSGKLTDQQLTAIIMRPYISLDLID